MSDIRWIKICTDMGRNKKIKRIRKMPEGNNIVLIWIMLLLQAGESNKSGGIYLTDTIPFTVEDLAIELEFDIDIIRMALIVLEKFGMIEIYDDIIFIKNWEEYQSEDKLARIREQTRVRVQKSREKGKQKTLCNVTDPLHVTQGNEKKSLHVTQGNAIERELELEKERDTIVDCKNENTNKKINVGQCPTLEILDLFNSICIDLPKIKSIQGNRLKKLQTWWNDEPDIENIKIVFQKVQASEFMSGRNGKWPGCCFDWVLKADNRQKIAEGNYDNRNITPPKPTSRDFSKFKRA
jgi:predicted phage replisome organizer